MKKISVQSSKRQYDIIIQDNLLSHLSDYLDSDRQYILIHDDLIPLQYVHQVKKALPKVLDISFPEGESSKSFEEYIRIIHVLQENNIKRDACLIALGGGVTGDLSGYIAATYLRGIDFVQIPTSLLAQIDSSVGGKVAINTKYAKNSIGAFYPPNIVLIDPLTLKTLSKRHFSNGMAEMIKYGMIYSKSFFNRILTEDVFLNLEYFIEQSLLIKKYFVENDEFDQGLRQILNFGHTYGHAYEAYYQYQKYYHGEAIGLGMIKVCHNKPVQRKLLQILDKFNLPTTDTASDQDLIPFIKNDKKNYDNHINLIIVDEIGKANIVKSQL